MAQPGQGLETRRPLGAPHDQEERRHPAPRSVHRRLQGHRQAATRLLEPASENDIRRRRSHPSAGSRGVAARNRVCRPREPIHSLHRGHVGVRHRRRRPAGTPGVQSHVQVSRPWQVVGNQDRRRRRIDFRRPLGEGRRIPADRHRARRRRRPRKMVRVPRRSAGFQELDRTRPGGTKDDSSASLSRLPTSTATGTSISSSPRWPSGARARRTPTTPRPRP